MVLWNVNDKYDFCPVFLNGVQLHKTEPGFVQLGRGHVHESTVSNLFALCCDSGKPLIVDMSDIASVSRRAFNIFMFHKSSIKREVFFVNATSQVIDRILDDAHDLFGVVQGDNNKDFQVLTNSSSSVFLEELATFDVFNVYRERALCCINDVIVPYPEKEQHSTAVYSTKYFNAKLLFHNHECFQICVYILAKLIKSNFDSKYDVLISASRNGAFLASPVASLLHASAHCWVNLGPRYVPKNALDWPLGNNKRCLLIADMISMGTEVKVVQAALASKKSYIVGCAALATYMTPKIDNVALVDRHYLNECGYELYLPDRNV